MDSKILKSLFIFLVTGFFVFSFNSNVNAADSASISLFPNQGNFNVNDVFTVDVVVDGGGMQFNAAKATLNLSNNVAIQDLTLGDCGFAFVNTPSVKKPSFTGVLLGSSSGKCTVYKLTLKATSEGTASLSLVDGSIKSYKRSEEILSSLGTATFTIDSPSSQSTGQQNNPQINQTNQVVAQPIETPPSQAEPSSYTVVFTIKDESGTPLANATTVLTPQASTGAPMPNQTVLSESDGTVKFYNVPKGVYKVETTYRNAKVADNVLAINGPTQTITLGIQAKKTFNYLWLLLIIPFVAIIALVVYLFTKKRKPVTHIHNVSQYSPTNQ